MEMVAALIEVKIYLGRCEILLAVKVKRWNWIANQITKKIRTNKLLYIITNSSFITLKMSVLSCPESTKRIEEWTQSESSNSLPFHLEHKKEEQKQIWSLGLYAWNNHNLYIFQYNCFQHAKRRNQLIFCYFRLSQSMFAVSWGSVTHIFTWTMQESWCHFIKTEGYKDVQHHPWPHQHTHAHTHIPVTQLVHDHLMLHEK